MRSWIIPIVVFLGIATPAAAQTARVHGFADVNYLFTERDIPEGFNLGQLVGHAAIGLTERVSVFSEVSLTGNPSGYAVEVERLVLRYAFADHFKLSAGRYHTPISYWNTAFHHGLWLQTSVARPEYTKFGSRFVPVHFVGLLAEGTLPALRLSPGYFVGVGNGRAGNIARAGDAGDVNDRRAWLGGVFVRPAALYGLQVGVAVYRDHLGVDGQIDETILAAHVVWAKETPEVMAEYARVVHEPDDGFGDLLYINDSYYLQVAYRLPDEWHALKPYARIENIESPFVDPVFGPLDLEYNAALIGIRYDFSMLAALKIEFRNERFGDGDRENSLYVQASFTFPSMDEGPR